MQGESDMEKVSWWAGVCTYCAGDIEGEQTPLTDHAGGPVNMDWKHTAGDTNHDAVPRGHTTRTGLVLTTSLGTTQVEQVRQEDLAAGEVFIGPDQDTVYRVTVPCADEPRGWLYVQNVALDGVPCPDCHKYGGNTCQVCNGTGLSGAGFFSYSVAAGPTMYRVTANL